MLIFDKQQYCNSFCIKMFIINLFSAQTHFAMEPPQAQVFFLNLYVYLALFFNTNK